MKKSLLVLSMLSILFVSCSKDDKDEPVTPTKENLTGSFKKTAHVVAGVNIFNNSDESMNMYQACERDDLYKLNADLTFEYVDAGTVCSPAGDWDGSWALTNSTTLDIDGDVYTIKSYNGSTIVLEQNMSGIISQETFVKQ